MKIIPRERLDLVEQLYLAGTPERSIQQQVAARFGVSKRAANRYLHRVRQRLAARPAPDLAAIRSRSEAMLLEAYDLAKAAGDVRTMATVADRLAVLHGAAGPTRLEHSGPEGGPIEVLSGVILLPPETDE